MSALRREFTRIGVDAQIETRQPGYLLRVAGDKIDSFLFERRVADADAAVRHPYKTDAPRGGEAVARSEVGYSLNRLDLINLSQEEWQDVEVWVNQKYVVFLPKVEPSRLKIINFQMLYDGKGNYFPLDNKKVMVSKVEVLKDGKMYDVPVRLGE